MKAVAYQNPLPITDVASLQDVLLPDPVATGRDLLVEIKAVAVNPVSFAVPLPNILTLSMLLT